MLLKVLISQGQRVRPHRRNRQCLLYKLRKRERLSQLINIILFGTIHLVTIFLTRIHTIRGLLTISCGFQAILSENLTSMILWTFIDRLPAKLEKVSGLGYNSLQFDHKLQGQKARV